MGTAWNRRSRKQCKDAAFTWLVVLTILKNMKVNGKDPNIYYGKSKNDPNHQPDSHVQNFRGDFECIKCIRVCLKKGYCTTGPQILMVDFLLFLVKMAISEVYPAIHPILQYIPLLDKPTTTSELIKSHQNLLSQAARNMPVTPNKAENSMIKASEETQQMTK